MGCSLHQHKAGSVRKQNGQQMTTPDQRRTLTLKSEAFTPEFRAMLNKAAKRKKQTQAAFVAETLTTAARRVLTGNPENDPESNPSAPPPAVIEDLTAKQAATDERLSETNRQIRELVAQVKTLSEAQRRGLWARILGH